MVRWYRWYKKIWVHTGQVTCQRMLPLEFPNLSHPLSGLSGWVYWESQLRLDIWISDHRYRRINSGYQIIVIYMFQMAFRGATLKVTLRSHWAPRTWSCSPCWHRALCWACLMCLMFVCRFQVLASICCDLTYLLVLWFILITCFFSLLPNELPWPLTFIFQWLGCSFPAQ